MRVSEGEPRGRFTELYNQGIFQEHEEVIVFTRQEFNRIYTSIQEQIDYINRTDLHLDWSQDWKLIGYWPKIMERVHILDANMDSIFKKDPLQCYLDTYFYETASRSKKKAVTPENTVSINYSLTKWGIHHMAGSAMRYSYGIMDRKKIYSTTHNYSKGRPHPGFPQQRLLQMARRHKEYIDGLYQINNREETEPINIVDLNLALDVLGNITEELENLFNSETAFDLSYQYISTLDEKYKKRGSSYTSDMKRCDMRVTVITPSLKYQHFMEIVKHVEREFGREKTPVN